MGHSVDFIEELRWRGMLHDVMPGTAEYLLGGMRSGYVGIDPTADSLHIGHLVSVMLLRHFQRCGHRPFVLLGGATGMIGDPSGRSTERNLLSWDELQHNVSCLREQLAGLVDFGDTASNAAKLVNNYDWMGGYRFLDFIRDIGKHITVNYMMAKDSVRRRLEGGEGQEGLSFTEFSYQLIQATDFLELHRQYGVDVQFGGSDQWGNITTGSELIRRMDGATVYGVTCPLITKSDGRKFGKTEQGNVWLSPSRTSSYQFYQFWLNVADEDASRYLKIFTELDRARVEALMAEQSAAPERRVLQQELAKQVTTMVHGQAAYEKALRASAILFGKDTHDELLGLDEATFLSVFAGVPQYHVAKSSLEAGVSVVDLLCERTQVYGSKGELRRAVKQGGLSINKRRVSDADQQLTVADSLNGHYILVQRGKKDYYILRLE